MKRKKNEYRMEDGPAGLGKRQDEETSFTVHSPDSTVRNSCWMILHHCLLVYVSVFRSDNDNARLSIYLSIFLVGRSSLLSSQLS
jgi:hypothetical protein